MYGLNIEPYSRKSTLQQYMEEIYAVWRGRIYSYEKQNTL
jgi:hypothetical protein